jgi:hypothetical protein
MPVQQNSSAAGSAAQTQTTKNGSKGIQTEVVLKKHDWVVSFIALFVISACSLVNMAQDSGAGGRPTKQSFQPSVPPSQPSLAPEAGTVVESPSAPE